MKRWRRAVLAVAGAACFGCADAPLAAEDSRDSPISASSARSAVALVSDAANRATQALDDPVVAGELRVSLTRIAAMLERGDGDGADRLLTSARHRLEAYARNASATDAADRDVIAFALDGAQQLLHGPTATH